jgi:hypothetical protein
MGILRLMFWAAWLARVRARLRARGACLGACLCACVHRYPHGWTELGAACMGYSIRTEQWRYTEWVRFNCSLLNPMSNCADAASAGPHWHDTLCGVELYNHTGDPSTDFHT